MVINAVSGVRTTNVLIDHIHRNGELVWIGYTDAPDLALVDAPNAPAGFDKLLKRARTTYAGIAAEDLFAGPQTVGRGRRSTRSLCPRFLLRGLPLLLGGARAALEK